MRDLLHTAFERDIFLTAVRVAIVVGTILVAINYGDRVFNGSLLFSDYVKIVITYFVPYFVSTYSSVKLKSRQTV